VIFEDRELLAELSRVNTDVPTVTLSILDGSFTQEQHDAFAARLIAPGKAIQRRGRQEVIDGSVVVLPPELPSGGEK
jgi:hypothetical protein